MDVNEGAVVLADPWASIVGQADAKAALNSWIADPVHAFLFTGPAGTGKAEAAFAFAGAILAHDLPEDQAERHMRLALGRKHPDVEMFSPQANQVNVEGARALIPLIFKKPVEGRRRIVIFDRFHAATGEAAGSLLKSVEEPPAGTILILLRETVLPEHIAIASRCTEVSFPALPVSLVTDWLLAQEVDGSALDAEQAGRIAVASGGDIRRAEMLLTDESFGRRAEAWHLAPTRLDGSGHAVSRVVGELRELIDEAASIVDPFHERDIAELAEREEMLGTRGSGRKDIEDRHKREVRKIRTDELRFGLAVLSRRYAQRLASGGGAETVAAINRIRGVNEELIRNPTEALLLQDLFWHLPALAD